MKQQTLIKNLLAFYIEAEKLKTTMRHSWTSDKNRQESSADHSWMLCLVAMTIFEHLDIQLDQLRVLKMLVLHDLAEAITGDIPAFDKKGRIGKYAKEKKAMQQLLEPLPETTKHEFLELWNEYELRETIEAKVAQAIDKFEAPLQHNISDISTWDENDFTIHGRYKMQYMQFNSFLTELRLELEHMSKMKITQAKQLHRLTKETQQYYQTLKRKDED